MNCPPGEPAAANLPSAVSATSGSPLLTGILLTFSRDLASMTSSAPASTASRPVLRMQITISFPSLVTCASLAQPLRGTFLICSLSFPNVENVLAPAGDIEPASVGRESHHLGRLDALDHLDDLVGRRVDHINCGSASVRDIDPGRTRH